MLISEEYRALNAQMHEEKPHYGNGAGGWAKSVRALMDHYSTKELLDYGCGKKSLKKALRMRITSYDPAIPGLDEEPEPHDIVACIDVLEHVEPENLDDVLRHLAKLTKKAGFFVICTRPAGKELPDGRNAHLIVENGSWWKDRLSQYFNVLTSDDKAKKGNIVFIVRPKR